jgi:WD40 repeat protein
MAPGCPSFREHGHGFGIAVLAYCLRNDEIELVTAGKDGRIKVWDTKGELSRQTDDIDCDGAIYCVAVSPNGQVIAAGNETAVNVRLIDICISLYHKFISQCRLDLIKHATINPDYVCSFSSLTIAWSLYTPLQHFNLPSEP